MQFASADIGLLVYDNPKVDTFVMKGQSFVEGMQRFKYACRRAFSENLVCSDENFCANLEKISSVIKEYRDEMDRLVGMRKMMLDEFLGRQEHEARLFETGQKIQFGACNVQKRFFKNKKVDTDKLLNNYPDIYNDVVENIERSAIYFTIGGENE
jgi:hypothetical protein